MLALNTKSINQPTNHSINQSITQTAAVHVPLFSDRIVEPDNSIEK
jgi:hypothetical protein